MSITLADITRSCDSPNAKGIGGILYVAFKSDVQTIPAEQTYTPGSNDPRTIASNLTMVSGKTFYEWTISKNDKGFECTPEGNEDGSIYKTSVKVFIPKVAPLKTYLLGGMTNGCEAILIVTDKNGNKRLVGDLTEGCTITAKEIITTDKNGYEVEFTWESALPPPYYTGTITT